MSLLQSYLRHAAEKPFLWGECDCCLFAADWIKWQFDVDIAADLRGDYCSEAGAQTVLRKEGGFLCLAQARLTKAGFKRVQTPARGDIGLVETAYGDVAAIMTEKGWACKTMRGIVVARFGMIAAWRR